MTVVPPSGTRTSDCMRCVSIPGTPATAIPVLSVLFSIVTRNTTVPASVICGVIERRNGTDTNVVVTTAVPLAACVVCTGICEPLSICAGRLFKAVTRGVATVFAWPFDSASVINALICALPNKPVVKPMTVLAAAAAMLLVGTGVPVNPPKTPNGFGPDFGPCAPDPPEPEPPEPDPEPLPLPEPLCVFWLG